MGRRLSSRAVTVLALLVVLPLTGFLISSFHPVAGSPMLTENFMNNAFNSSIWKTFQQGHGPIVTVANQSLIVTIPSSSTNDPSIGGFGAGLESLCDLHGDFDMQIAFQLLVWPHQNGVRVGLGPSVAGFGVGSAAPYAVERDSFSIGDTLHGEYYVTHMIDGVQGLIPGSDLTGYLRITRTGTIGTGYYLNGSNWVQIHAGPVVTSDTGFGFAAWSHDFLFSHQTEKIAFNNFTLNSGQIQCPRLIANPKSGPIGTLVTVQGTGFPTIQNIYPGSRSVTVTFDDMTLGSTTNDGGSFTFMFDVPLAQNGPHQIKATDYTTGTNTTTTFQVTAAQTILSVSLTVGTVYFPGDTAVTEVLVTANGVPVGTPGIQLNLTLTRPDNSRLTLNATPIGAGLFKVSYLIPKTALIGTYSILAVAHDTGIGDGSSLGSFEVKLPWLSSQGQTMAIAGVASIATVGVALVSWRKGYLKRPARDPF